VTFSSWVLGVSTWLWVGVHLFITQVNKFFSTCSFRWSDRADPLSKRMVVGGSFHIQLLVVLSSESFFTVVVSLRPFSLASLRL
jgi:hypothetical protein